MWEKQQQYLVVFLVKIIYAMTSQVRFVRHKKRKEFWFEKKTRRKGENLSERKKCIYARKVIEILVHLSPRLILTLNVDKRKIFDVNSNQA